MERAEYLRLYAIKKIPVRDLRKRMYVCGGGYGDTLGAEWAVTEGYRVLSDNGIARLREKYTHVWIDTGCGVDTLRRDEYPRLVPAMTPRPDRPEPTDAGADNVPGQSLIRQARDLREQAVSIVGSLMEDIRFGRTLELRGAREAVEETIHQVLKNTQAMIYLALLKNTDTSLAQRSVNTAILSLAFAKCLSIPKKDLLALGLGALLHDVGMTRVPETVRNKTGPLDEAEFLHVSGHVGEGLRLLRNTGGIPKKALSIVRTHHERFDGTGYPAGLKGKDIGLLDRMVAIVSVYSALTSERPYARAISIKAALGILYDECGKGFDTRLVHKFIQCIGVYPPGCPVELNTGEMGVVVAVDDDHRLHPVVRIDIDADRSPLAYSQQLDLSRSYNRNRVIKRVMEPGEYQIQVSADHTIDRLRLLPV